MFTEHNISYRLNSIILLLFSFDFVTEPSVVVKTNTNLTFPNIFKSILNVNLIYAIIFHNRNWNLFQQLFSKSGRMANRQIWTEPNTSKSGNEYAAHRMRPKPINCLALMSLRFLMQLTCLEATTQQATGPQCRLWNFTPQLRYYLLWTQ